MKRLIFPAIVLVGLASCSKPGPPVDTVGEQNKALVQKYSEAIVRGDTADLESFLSDDFRSSGPAMKDSSNREQQVDSWKKNWRDSWASVNFDRQAMVAFTIPPGEKHPGDWVADWANITVKYKNRTPSATFFYHAVSRVKEGKIDRTIVYYNVNDILVQQGFTLTPPASKEGAKPKEIKKKVVKKKPARKKK